MTIKTCDMAPFSFQKLVHHYSEASFPSQHVNEFFKQSAMEAILFFKHEAKMFYRHVFTAINIPCKFGEDVFINDKDIFFIIGKK